MLCIIKEFKFPDVGEGIHEGKLVKWHANVGDKVVADATIVEVETDKAIVELPSPYSGILSKRNFKEGDTVPVGSVILTIDTEESESFISSITARVVEKPISEPAANSRPLYQASSAPNDPSSLLQILATPSTRRLARELSIDLTRVLGTGPSGRITDDDISKFASQTGREKLVTSASQPAAQSSIQKVQVSAPPPIITPMSSDERIPLSGIRKVVAQRMVYSKTHIPHACGMDFVDVSRLVEMREREKKVLEPKGIKITYLPFVLKACSLALKQFPYVNSNFDEERNEIVLKKDINISIAVDTPDGLTAPVLKNANQKSVIIVAQEIEQLAALARERKLKVDDLRGGTFTITNIGSVGGFFSTPIINPPEVAILGVHRIKDMPLVIEGKVEARKVMGLSLCFDHRVIDGAMATEFMNALKQYLEDPELMLMALV